jgi:hypothetical protein
MTTTPEIRTYAQAKALLDKRRKQGRYTAKLGNNIYLEQRYHSDTGECIAVKYHQTDIVTFYSDGKIELRCGGWNTVTTKQNISTFSPFSVYQEKGEWFVNTSKDYSQVNRAKCPKGTLPPGIVRFKDGMILDTPKWATK